MKQSKLLRNAMALTIALGMAGCAATQAPSLFVPSASKLGAAVKLSGTLRLTINWPNRNYNTAFLPDSTNRVLVQIKKGSTVVENAEVTRSGSESSVTTSLVVDAGTGYDLAVLGYHDATIVARGSASGITVNSGRITRASVIMSAETTPRIETVRNAQGQPVAKIGDQVTLTGANFGNEASLSLEVTLGGAAIPAGSVTREGTDSIKVTIPAGSKSGLVKIKVDGVDSESINPLWLINGLSLPATASMVNGANLTLLPTIGWLTQATESASDFGTPPEPSYTVDPVGHGAVAANTFTANAHSETPGDVTVNLTASMAGTSSDPMAVTIHPKINLVHIPDASSSINATDASSTASVAPGYTNTVHLYALISGDSFNRGVDWTTSDATLATVDADGWVTANNTGKAGTVTITATSKDDNAKSDQFTITVTNYGSAELEVK